MPLTDGKNWDYSKAITPLKRDFLKGFFKRENSFFLTGGSALGIFYLSHRLSYDLDFFTCMKEVDWLVHESCVREVCDEIGADLEIQTRAKYIHRYLLRRGKETEKIDFVAELVKQIDPVKNNIENIIVDTEREIGVNKICLLLNRMEQRDLVDLYFLDKDGFNIIANVKYAAQKDGGLNPVMLSELLKDFDLKRKPDNLLLPLDMEDFRKFAEHLRVEFLKMSFPDKKE
jgi:hypothetical protein